MAQLAAPIAIGMKVVEGIQTKSIKDKEARGLNEAASRRRGAAHREMAEEERKKEFMYSRALAVAAASGAGTADQGVVALLGDINAEGEYRIMSRLYTGETEAQGLDYQAEVARKEGEAAFTSGVISGVSTGIKAYGGSFGATTTTSVPSPTYKKASFGGRARGFSG